ncbi:hypothetical protein LZ554_005136 [Drepanopeziza brunnea f. sp. 'monogermtubi']|nr:hypothetical protein LZ554_005136 [Drepanopeziza brunnea f. sp. 'monogermtubi']
MGNLCGKESPSPSDAFAKPGRTVGSAPPPNQNTTAALPKKVQVGGPPRTLGSTPSPNPHQSSSNSTQDDARRKAAEAAEARANAQKPKGKLGAQLLEQKKQTQSQTLDALSRDERRARDADAAADTRAYN